MKKIITAELAKMGIGIFQWWGIILGVSIVFYFLNEISPGIIKAPDEPIKAICIDFIQKEKPK